MTRVGPYSLEAPLGRGGMAEVFRARAPDGRAVVVKRILPELAADRDFRSMLQDEARHVRALRHPGIVPLVDDGEDDGIPYLVLELVDGVDLGAVIRRTGPLPPSAVARLGADVASALRHAHGRGVIHRDVTPGNILVDVGGRARLADFGIARAATSRAVTMHGTVKGKPGYLAPEQALGTAVDGRTDLYALGVSLAEALLGRPLFEGEGPAEAAARLAGRAPALSLPEGTPDALRDVVARCLEPDPRGRPSEAEEVEEALETVAGEDGRNVLAAAVAGARAATTAPLPAPRPFEDEKSGTAVTPPPRRRGLRARDLRWPIVFAAGLLVAAFLGYRAGRTALEGAVGSAEPEGEPESPAAVARSAEEPPLVTEPAPAPAVESAPAPPPRSAKARPRPRGRPAEAPPEGTLVLERIPLHGRLLLDGEPVEITDSDMRLPLRAGQHVLSVETMRGRRFEQTIDVPAGGEAVFRVPRGQGGRGRGFRGGSGQ